MTVNDMHILYKVFLDKIDSSAYSEILPEEIDIHLNEAQDRFVKTRYNINNIYKSGFEQSQKRIDDLRNLIVTKYCQVSEYTNNELLNSFIVDINALYDDEAFTQESDYVYMFFIKGIAHSTIENCGESWTRLKFVQQDDITTVIYDPFNKPLRGKPLMCFENGAIVLLAHQDVVIDNFMLTCLRHPVQMDNVNLTTVDCELAEHTHREIVQIAVQIALEGIEAKRIETQQMLNINKME